MTTETVNLEFSPAEAVVLYEFVSRFEHSRKLEINHFAERIVLWEICALLEKALDEQYSPKWNELLEMARKEVQGDATE